jgi:hypothetical protein
MLGLTIERLCVSALEREGVRGTGGIVDRLGSPLSLLELSFSWICIRLPSAFFPTTHKRQTARHQPDLSALLLDRFPLLASRQMYREGRDQNEKEASSPCSSPRTISSPCI